MKVTKTLAILFAAVLVVFCFNAPAVFSGTGTDGHPWDGDGGGDGGIDGSEGDTVYVVDIPTRCSSVPGGGDTGLPDLASFLKIVCYSFWQLDKIELQTQRAGAVVVRSGE
jgi:hypothetical protein